MFSLIVFILLATFFIPSTIIVCYSFLYLYLLTKQQLTCFAWLKKIIYECWLVNLGYLLWLWKFPVIYIPKTNSPTHSIGIVLIHGYSRDQNDWRWLMKKLKFLQMPIIALNLPTLYKTPEQLIPDMHAILTTASNTYHIDKWIFIGHSIGGIIAILYKQKYSNVQIQKIITIATPFFGTKLANLSLIETIRQYYSTNSVFLKKIRENLPNVMIYNIASTFDNIIIPWQSALLDTSTEQLILNSITHQALLRNKDIAKKILSWI